LARGGARPLEINLPVCFDAEAELKRVRYQFIGKRAVSWSDPPAPPKQPGKKRR